MKKAIIIIGIGILFFGFSVAQSQDIESEIHKAFLERQEAFKRKDYKQFSEFMMFGPELDKDASEAEKEERFKKDIQEIETWLKDLSPKDIQTICNEKITNISLITSNRALVEVTPPISYLKTYYLFKEGDKWKFSAVQHHYAWTLRRLQIVDRQIKNFYENYKRLPKDIEEVINHAPQIKNTIYDLFDDEKRSYKFIVSGDTYKLYSIGPDSNDDGGIIIYNPANGLVSNGDIVFSDDINIDAVTQASPPYPKK